MERELPASFQLRCAWHTGSVPPMTASPQELFLGARISGDVVMLASEARRRHLYIVGQTGTGKSTLQLNLIAQDLAAGEGLALLDPHGDLAEAVLLHIPRDRTNDLVYLNPADSERPIGFNPLSAVSEDLKPIVADGVVSAFRHVWPESWGPRLDYILTNAVRALLDVPGGTLLMLPRLLIDEAFRARLVEHHVSDSFVRAFWQGEYAAYGDHFRAEAISPIQNKIGKALIEPRLRNMLAQPRSTITLRRLMDEGAIVICNLAKLVHCNIITATHNVQQHMSCPANIIVVQQWRIQSIFNSAQCTMLRRSRSGFSHAFFSSKPATISSSVFLKPCLTG